MNQQIIQILKIQINYISSDEKESFQEREKLTLVATTGLTNGDVFDDTMSCFTDITSVSRNVVRPRPPSQVQFNMSLNVSS